MGKALNVSNSDEENENIAFHVNKSGIPIDGPTWDRMWRYAAKLNPKASEKIYELKNCIKLPPHKMNFPPLLHPQANVYHKLRQIQSYLSALTYNHTGTQFFEIRKNRPLAGLMDTAKEMIKESLPIKCLEAVIIAIFLTNEISTVERFPIGFKSSSNGKFYYHIVLGVYHAGKFGALGLSRKTNLMDKPMEYHTLHELISDYESSYSTHSHILRKVRLGAPVSRDPCSQERITWTVMNVNVLKTSCEEMKKKFERFSKDVRCHVIYPAAISSMPMRAKFMNLSLRREKTIASGERTSVSKSIDSTRDAKTAKSKRKNS